MKKRLACLLAGVLLLTVAFLAPLIGKAASSDVGSTATYWGSFRTLAPLTYPCLIVGVLLICTAILLSLLNAWAKM